MRLVFVRRFASHSGLHQSLAAPSRIAAKARVSGTRCDGTSLILPLDIFGYAGGEILAPKARDESERQIDSGGHAGGSGHTLVDYKSVASPDVDFIFGQGIEEFEDESLARNKERKIAARQAWQMLPKKCGFV